MTNADPLFFREYLHYVFLDLCRVFAFCNTDPFHDTLAVCINDDCGCAVDLSDNEICDLPSDAWNFHKKINIVRDHAAPLFSQFLSKSNY